MESGEGMVALVRGLGDSGLAVTLLDGNKQYTLMPNAAPPPPPSDMRSKHDVASQQTEVIEIEQPAMCDSGAQATDGRYASIYKMSHCRIKPTSPPVQLTEFPPQRAEINRGQGNFEVGGCGSGESYTPCKFNGSFRGGMSWPDRGSVCSPRQSRQPDAFANSLRKYPNVSAERSTELVERLINYTQAKHSRSYQSKSPSPSRQGNEDNMSFQVPDRCSTRSIHRSPSYQKKYDLDTNTCNRTRNLLEESPTRDIIRPRNRSIEYDYDDYRRRNLDPKHVKDISQKVRDYLTTMNSCSYTQNCVDGRERVATAPYGQRPVSVSILASSKSANIEVQAAVKMISKEVATQPRLTPIERPVAVPHSSPISKDDRKHKVPTFITNYVTSHLCRDVKNIENQCEDDEKTLEVCSKIFMSVQTSFSSVDLGSTRKCCKCNRKIKSQEDIRAETDIPNELLQWIKEVYSDKVSTKFWSDRMKKLAHRLTNPGEEEKIRKKIRTFLERGPSTLYDEEQKEFWEQLPDNIINKLKKLFLKTERRKNGSPIRIYRIEIPTSNEKHNNKNELRKLIKNWLNNVSIKKKDFLNRTVKREDVLNFIVKQLEPYVPYLGRFAKDNKRSILKHVVKNLLEDIPIRREGATFLNELAASLVDNLFQIKNKTCERAKLDNENNIHDYKCKILKDIVSYRVAYILEEINMPMDCSQLHLLQEKLTDMLSDMSKSKFDFNENVHKNVYNIIMGVGRFNENEVIFLTDKLIKQFKNDICYFLFEKSAEDEKSTEINFFSEAPSVFNYTSVSNDKNLIEDKEYVCSSYKQVIEQQIQAWLRETSLVDLFTDKNSQDKAVNDLAEDIVDRHKYLKMNLSSSCENEVCYLKYQIFKWINKIIGEGHLETINRAPELMKRIQGINVPKVLGSKNKNNLNLNTASDQTEYTRSPLSLSNCDRLHDEIVQWLTEDMKTPNDSNSQIAKELIYKIEDCILQNMPVNYIIENNVDNWVKTVLKVEQESYAIEKLKQSLKNILQEERELSKFDPKREKKLIRMYEDIIDDWLDKDLFVKNVQLFYIRERNEFIHDLAVKLFETQYLCKELLEDLTVTEMKLIISDWSTNILAYINEEIKFSDHIIFKLIHAIQDCQSAYNNASHEYCSQIVLALRNWMNTLLLCENASVIEKRRLMYVINNLATRLSIINGDPSMEILQFLRMVWHPTQEDEIMKQIPNNLQIYLQELNLFKEGSNKDEPYGQTEINRDEVNDLPGLETKKQKSPRVTIYGFTLPSKSERDKQKTVYLQDDSIKPITEADMDANHDLYMKQLVAEIDDWLNGLNIPEIRDKGFREIVVNDLAGDIIDRQKYLELNSRSTETEEKEVDQLRYQIFKWINKLVGEEYQETLQHAPDLMYRIKSIPVPMFVNQTKKNQDASPSGPLSKSLSNVNNNGNVNNQINSNNYHCCANNNKDQMNEGNERLSSPLGFTTGPMATSSKQNVNPLNICSKCPKNHLKNNENTQDKNHSGSATLGLEKSMNNEQSNKGPDGFNRLDESIEDKSQSSCESIGLRPLENPIDFDQPNILIEESGSIPQGMTLQELYGYFDKVFTNKIQELPLETPTPDQERLVNLARVGIYNGIWKTFYTFLQDPDIANDYCLFDLLFEEKIDNMLDCLPQTQDMQQIRPGWKSGLLNDLLLMLKYVQSIIDKPNIREIISKGVDRQLMRSVLSSQANKAQHRFIARTAEAYILSSRYKDEDPIRANIYRQRLMKRLEELADNVKRQHNIEFNEINPTPFSQLAFRVLGDVPIPDKEKLDEEAEEILLEQEIEEWYKDLPVRPVTNEDNAHLRKRLREILAKRLRDLEKRIDAFGDPSLEVEREMKHEISIYLEKGAELKQVNDLNINFMVEELTKRIKNRRENNMLGYETFEKENPACSTFVQTDPGDVMAPLVDLQQNLNNQSFNQIPVTCNVLGPRERAYSLPTNNNSKNIPTGPGGQIFSFPTAQQRQCNLGGNMKTDPQGHAITYQNGCPSYIPQNTSRELSTNTGLDAAGMATLRPKVSVMPNNYVPCAPQQIENGQAGFLSSGNFQGLSSQGIASATGFTGSTARVDDNVGLSEPQVPLEDLENNDQARYKCHCMERLPVCSIMNPFDDLYLYPSCYSPMPRCRCHY